MPYKKETILPLVEKLKQLNDYENIAGTIQSGVDFLTGHTYETPVFPTAETARQMGHFISLLQIPDHWDDNDRLILKLISPPLTWNECRETFLTTIIPMMDMPGTSSSIVLRFSYFTSYLQQRGCTPEEIGSLMISYSRDGNNFDLAPLKFTPLRKFLQDLIKSAEPHVIDAYVNTWRKKGWNSLFFRLLTKGHPDRELEYLENILLLPEYEPDQQAVSRVLLQNNLGKYEPLIEKTTTQQAALPDYAAALSGYYLLAGHLPEKYNQRLLKAAYDFLDRPATGPHTPESGYSQVTGNVPPNNMPPGVLAVRGLLHLDRPAAIPYLGELISQKRYLHPEAFQVLADELQEQAAPMLLHALENDYDARTLLPVLTQLNKALYIDQLWPYTLHKLKSVRTLVAVILAEHPQALEQAAELLGHKKADQRLTAVQILSKLDNPHARELLQLALHKEVNDDARDLMLETLGGHTLTDTDDLVLVTKLVMFARKRHKLSKPAEKWLDDKALPPLYLLDGTVMTTDMMRFLIYRMSRVTEVHADVEAKPLLRLIDRSRSGDFARALYKAYADQGGDLKLKYLMTLTALLGDDLLADTLREDIQLWITTKRLKMAEHGVGALALHGSNKALREVEFFSRRYRFRKGVVGAAAIRALELTATGRGMTLPELIDSLVPDFGFDGLYKSFEVKDETYRAFLDSHFKPAYLNDKGRRLKAIPVATSREIRNAFKALPKEMADTIKVQAQRLELFLEEQRKWSAAQWHALFRQNPVMSAFATRLVWALFDETDQLTTAFYCDENITPKTLSGNTLTLPENTSVRILHPIHLDAATLQQWKDKFNELSVVPVFPQLERPVTPSQNYAAVEYDYGDASMENGLPSGYMEQEG
jgi:hypothetical protein